MFEVAGVFARHVVYAIAKTNVVSIDSTKDGRHRLRGRPLQQPRLALRRITLPPPALIAISKTFSSPHW